MKTPQEILPLIKRYASAAQEIAAQANSKGSVSNACDNRERATAKALLCAILDRKPTPEEIDSIINY